MYIAVLNMLLNIARLEVLACDVYRRFGGTYYFSLQGRGLNQANKIFIDPQDGGTAFLPNFSKVIPYYTALHPIR
jgi:hypothetical protein